MIPHIVRIIAMVAALGALASVGYSLLCLWSAANFLHDRRAAGKSARPTQPLPPVSILKPLKGTDPEMYESFRSHCLQDYPDYEIIFGVSDSNDPAAQLVRRLQTEFPQRAIQLVECPERLGTNLKVSNLAQMVKVARHEHLVVSDSDIRVSPQYLRRVVMPLLEPHTGLVTCLYRGAAAPTLGSRLESLGISTDFCAGVLAARQLEGGIHFGLGSTLAFRRNDLEDIGGFEAVADYLGDDYEIGRRISDRGLEVRLSDEVVETFLPPYSLREMFRHQLRWARTIRDSRRWGYAGLALTFGLPWALLAVICSYGAPWAWLLLGGVVAVRIAMALVVGQRVLDDRQVSRWLALVPLRDFIGLLVWLAGFMGHEIVWRGDSFELRDGKLVRTGS
jgi:ceramide glucosyltransferase